jgi:CheY-like chemotaxis protein
MIDRSKVKITLIDEKPVSRDEISTNLINLGYQVLLMADIRNSYPKVKRILPDLIIISPSKPKVQTYAFIKALRESDWGKDIPLIFIDEDDSSFDKTKESLKDFHIDLILKLPFEKKILEKTLDKLLSLKHETFSIEEQETLEIKTIPFQEEIEKPYPVTDEIPIDNYAEETIFVEDHDSVDTVKIDVPIEKISDQQQEPVISSRRFNFLKLRKSILYIVLFLIFLVIFPLLYSKFKPFIMQESIEESAEYSKGFKEMIKEGDVSVPDQMKFFHEKMIELQKKGIEKYFQAEYSLLDKAIIILDNKSKDKKSSKKELMKEIITISKTLDSLSSQFELTTTQEKAKAIGAIKEIENIINIINNSKLKISSNSELQNAKSEYIKAQELAGMESVDYKKVFELAAESIGKLMKLPEYNILKLQDDKTIKLRADADYYYDLGMYVFPEDNNALKTYQEILKIHPTNQHSIDRIKSITNIIKFKGDQNYETGNMPGAYVHYKEYIKLVPDDGIVRKRLKEIEESKEKQVNFWDLVKGINPLLWVFLIGFVVVLYKFFPILINDIKNAYILIGAVAIFLLLLLLFT